MKLSPRLSRKLFRSTTIILSAVCLLMIYSRYFGHNQTLANSRPESFSPPSDKMPVVKEKVDNVIDDDSQHFEVIDKKPSQIANEIHDLNEDELDSQDIQAENNQNLLNEPELAANDAQEQDKEEEEEVTKETKSNTGNLKKQPKKKSEEQEILLPPSIVESMKVSLKSLFPKWKFPTPAQSKKKPRYAYAFYAAQDIYVCLALVNAKRLRLLESEVEIVLILSYGLNPPPYLTQKAIELQIKVVHAELSITNTPGYYINCMDKLLVFKMTEYDRIIFMDSDSLIVRNMDELFRLPSTHLAIPRAGWLKQPYVTSWFMVVEPNSTIYDRIAKYASPNTIKKDNFFDMDLLNQEFIDDAMILPYWMGILDSYWQDINNKKFDLDWLASNVYVLHFSSSKPWLLDLKGILQKYPTPHPFYVWTWETILETKTRECR